MATQIKINDVLVLQDYTEGKDTVSYEESRVAIKTLLTTSNPLTDGIAASLDKLPDNAPAFLEVIKKSGKIDDVFSVEEKPQGTKDWTFAASCTRKVLIARLALAINRKDYEVTLPAKSEAKVNPANVVKGKVTSL